MSLIRFSTFPIIFFPLLFAAILSGGDWGYYYFFGFIVCYLVCDNFLPDMKADVSKKHAWLYEVFLLLHIPLSVWALLLLYGQLAPGNIFLNDISRFTINFLPFISEKTQLQGTYDWLACILACGFVWGHNTAVAHELMHRNERFLHEASRLLFGICGDAQVVISHIHSHHIKVSTLDDPTSARRGESIYQFFIRAITGQYKDSLAFENKRLNKQSAVRKVLTNQVVNGVLISLVMLFLSYLMAGIKAVLLTMVLMFIAKWLLESINYVQHYGLVRVPGKSVEARHSWETRKQGSTTWLYNASRHGGHHVNGSLPFWHLKGADDAPILKHGYMLAIITAMLPPLWFRYISPYIQHWDANLSSEQEQALLAKYLNENQQVLDPA